MQYGKIYKRACEYRVVERLAKEIELTAANMIILEYKRDFRRDEAPNIKKKLESTKLPPLTFHMSIPYPKLESDSHMYKRKEISTAEPMWRTKYDELKA